MTELFKTEITRVDTGYRFSCKSLGIEGMGRTPEEAAENVSIAVENALANKYKEGMIPTGSESVDENFTIYVACDPERAFKKKFGNAVRKNVTIPQWMEFEARNSGIDLSKLLQKGIENELKERAVGSSQTEMFRKLLLDNLTGEEIRIAETVMKYMDNDHKDSGARMKAVGEEMGMPPRDVKRFNEDIRRKLHEAAASGLYGEEIRRKYGRSEHESWAAYRTESSM